MKKWLSKIISFFIKQENPKLGVSKVFGFQSLTPTSNADESGLYCAALDEALNEANHFNIALTGGYGTGKSSIIETYLSKSTQYTNQNVIRISLANFNFRKSTDNEKKRRPLIAGRNTNDNEEQIVLEISVLQQIIFQIQKKSVNRRFRKKIKQGYSRPFLYSLLVLVTVISSILFWSPTLLYKWFDMPNLYQIIESKWFLIFTFSLSFGGALVLIAFLIHRLLELRLSKFEIKSVGVNFDKKELEFSLNSHLDELIYLLKKGRINLMIFEDLDRFNDHEIFEKLREINHVLKYSPELRNEKVKFLYIIRESIFKTENEKNKFFDLIIPIVPFISTKNAQSKMLKLFAHEISSIAKGKLRNQFENVIKTAALCIDEMRTIKSIYNDYLIYLKVIEKNDKNTIYVPKDELLAIVIYKNLFPLDFEEINSGVSKLELVLNKRTDFLSELINSKKFEIKGLRIKLDNIQGESITTVKELRLEYINSLFNTLPFNQNIQLNGVPNIFSLPLEALSNDENFEIVIENGITVGNSLYSFDQIEEKNKNNLTYNERIEIINKNSKEQESKLEDRIRLIENEIKKLRNQSFSNIIKQSKKEDILKKLLKELLVDKATDDKLEKKNSEQEGHSKFDFKIDLVTSLILEGQINLNYRHYTSIFHDGDLSYNDRALYMKFKTGEVFDFEQHFDNPKSFLEQFTPTDWNNLTYFCEELFDEILYTQKYNEQLDLLFERGTEYHLKFLTFYIPRIPENTQDPKSSFIKKLSEHIFPNWKSFTEQAINSELFDNSSYDVVLTQLLLNQEIDIIRQQNKNNILSQYISEKSEISTLFPKDKNRLVNCKNKLIDIFRILNVEFYQIKEQNKTWVLDLILENDLYEITIDMLDTWGTVYSDEKLKIPSYSNVMNSSNKFVKDYINNNLDEYTANILLELKNKFSKWEEEVKWLKDLLNSEEDFAKDSIIEDVDFFEFNLSDYGESLWETIVSNEKLKCSWENIVLYKEKKGVDELLVNIINRIEWIKKLDYYNQEKAKDLKYQRTLEFWESLLEQKISEDSLKELKNKFGYYISESIISATTRISNLKFLISRKAFNPNKPLDVYEQIKSHFGDELIHLGFAKKYSTEILKHENNSGVFTSLRKDELIYIAKNDFPQVYFENAFIQIEDLESMAFEVNDASEILRLIKKYTFKGNELLLTILCKYLPTSEQIAFYVWLFENGVIDKFNSNRYLINFKGSLRNIEKPRYKFEISQNATNKRFVEVLREIELINDYKLNKSGDFTFYRNQFRSFNS